MVGVERKSETSRLPKDIMKAKPQPAARLQAISGA